MKPGEGELGTEPHVGGDPNGVPVMSAGFIGASEKYLLSYPSAGLVEQDPESLWQITLDTIKAAINDSHIDAKDLAGIGITGQRSTIIIWERDSGKSLGPAVIWQDLRGKQRANELIEKGFISLNSYLPAAKMEQVLGSLPNGYGRLKNNELAWGNVDSFPGEVAYAVLFLASDQASFINGVNLIIDGGLTAHTGAQHNWDVVSTMHSLSKEKQ